MTTLPAALDEGRLGAYLARIGLDASPRPDLDGLNRLHLAHVLRIPFENLDIHLGRPISLAPADIHRKIVDERRGGFCYEQNLLFAAALRAVGFEVDLLSARVYGEGGRLGQPFDHMTLRVLVNGDERLADVGFGECFREPILMDGSWCAQPDGARYRVVARGDHFTVEHASEKENVPDYRFELIARSPAQYEPMCRYHQTSPESHFTRRWVCSLATETGRVTAKPAMLVTTDGGVRSEEPIASLAQLQDVLRTRFGMTGITLPAAFPWRGRARRAGG